MFTNTPNRSAIVPAIENTTPNHADNVNAQIQSILDRLQYNYNLSLQIAERQTLLIQQYQNTGASTIAPLLLEIEAQNNTLNSQTTALIARLSAIAPNLTTLNNNTNTLTTSANNTETKASTRQIDVNFQRREAKLEAIAALTATSNTVVATNSSSQLFTAAVPNFGALPPSIWMSGWSPAIGSNSGFTAAQANTWIVIPLTQIYAGSGYSAVGNRVSITTGTYEIFGQTCGVGSIEFTCQLVQFVGATPTVVSIGSAAFTVASGGGIGQSWTVKSYIGDTLSLPACQLELQYRFKQAHSSAGLTGGMPVSTPALPEDFASLTLVRIA